MLPKTLQNKPAKRSEPTLKMNTWFCMWLFRFEISQMDNGRITDISFRHFEVSFRTILASVALPLSAWDKVQIRRPMILHLHLGPAAEGWDLLVDDSRIIDGWCAEVKAEVEKYAEEYGALLERTHKPGPVEKFLQNISVQRQAYCSGAALVSSSRTPSSRSTPSWTSSTAASPACMG
jgi:hypothetical protein